MGANDIFQLKQMGVLRIVKMQKLSIKLANVLKYNLNLTPKKNNIPMSCFLFLYPKRKLVYFYQHKNTVLCIFCVRLRLWSRVDKLNNKSLYYLQGKVRDTNISLPLEFIDFFEFTVFFSPNKIFIYQFIILSKIYKYESSSSNPAYSFLIEQIIALKRTRK